MNPKSQLEKRVDALETRGGSGGVGEAVGNHSERFNYYGTEYGVNVIDDSGNGMANRAGGQSNNLYGCQFADAYGISNILRYCRCVIVRGDSNSVVGDAPTQYKNAFILVGSSNGNYDENSGRYGTIRNSGVVGLGNKIFGTLNESFVIGDGIRIQGTVTDSLIVGNGVDIGTVGLVIFVGDGGGVSYGDRIVAGDSSNGICFKADRYGSAYAKQWQTIGADYAEMFEWADGNPGGEDRRGMLVSMCGDKIIPAHGDDFIGIISTNPSVIGNNPLHWHGKYKTDVFGGVIYDDNGDAVLSEEYDPKREYIPRSERPEWAAVGLTGRLIITDNGSCKPNGYVSARSGFGQAIEHQTRIRVMRRIDDTHVEVLIR
ncbi:MAG: hypothetical protein J6N15_12675 [Ruminiclostridium sp.]|nr:hypothetical protein [Ruminiclostridium sp.]